MLKKILNPFAWLSGLQKDPVVREGFIPMVASFLVTALTFMLQSEYMIQPWLAFTLSLVWTICILVIIFIPWGHLAQRCNLSEEITIPNQEKNDSTTANNSK